MSNNEQQTLGKRGVIDLTGSDDEDDKVIVDLISDEEIKEDIKEGNEEENFQEIDDSPVPAIIGRCVFDNSIYSTLEKKVEWTIQGLLYDDLKEGGIERSAAWFVRISKMRLFGASRIKCFWPSQPLPPARSISAFVIKAMRGPFIDDECVIIVGNVSVYFERRSPRTEIVLDRLSNTDRTISV